MMDVTQQQENIGKLKWGNGVEFFIGVVVFSKQVNMVPGNN